MPAKREKKDREFVDALARGLRVLESFNEPNVERNLSEVVRITGFSPATARRSLYTLAGLGYLRESNKRYSLTAQVLALSSAYLRSMNEQAIFSTEVKRLVAMFGDTSAVSVLIGTEAVCIAHEFIGRGLRPVVWVGARIPAYASAVGRVLLSGLADRALDQYLARVDVTKFTQTTEARKPQLRKEVQRIKQQGYAVVVDQLYNGVTAVAVPILSPTGEVVAALNSTTYSGSMSAKELVSQRLPELKNSAKRLLELMRLHPETLRNLQQHSDKPA
jgi:IclR family pca regulon transcriptional regulator